MTTNDPKLADLTCLLLRLQIHSRVFHWQTNSFAQHQAFGEFYGAISSLADEIVEHIQGRSGKDGKVSFVRSESICLCNLNQVDPVTLFSAYQVDLERHFLPGAAPDIENLLQEAIAAVSKLLYLLTLS